MKGISNYTKIANISTTTTIVLETQHACTLHQKNQVIFSLSVLFIFLYSHFIYYCCHFLIHTLKYIPIFFIILLHIPNSYCYDPLWVPCARQSLSLKRIVHNPRHGVSFMGIKSRLVPSQAYSNFTTNTNFINFQNKLSSTKI